MKEYLKLARFDHYIKNLFMLPGVLFAFVMTQNTGERFDFVVILINTVLAFVALCLVSSANYTLNEYVDAQFDKFHPEKKNRVAVVLDLKKSIVTVQYLIFLVVGLSIAWFTNFPCFLQTALLAFMGILYNVRPIRTKDLPYMDVLSESVNNLIRLLIGWYAATTFVEPPLSLGIGYWMGGAFLMTVKRYSEYRYINNPETAQLYRKSFKYYTENSLLLAAVFYAMMSTFLLGVFIIKFKIELVFCVPFLMLLFCWYLAIGMQKDSAAMKPEKLYRHKGMLLLIVFIAILGTVLMFIPPIPQLEFLMGWAF